MMNIDMTKPMKKTINSLIKQQKSENRVPECKVPNTKQITGLSMSYQHLVKIPGKALTRATLSAKIFSFSAPTIWIYL